MVQSYFSSCLLSVSDGFEPIQQQSYIKYHLEEATMDEETQKLMSTKVLQPLEQQTSVTSEAVKADAEIKQIVHKVVYGETLQGLSLQYSVPISKIRYRNHIDGDAIYHLKEIIIPNPLTIPVIQNQLTKTLLVEHFMEYMDYSEKDRKIARFYMGQADWNLDLARQEYKSDLDWERKNKNRIASTNLQPMEVQMKEIRRYYDRQGLKQKKNL